MLTDAEKIWRFGGDILSLRYALLYLCRRGFRRPPCLQTDSESARKDPEARFTFLGGDLMAAEAGHRPLLHFRDMAFMGFSEVIRNFGRIGRNLALARETLEKERPDALIVVDYPDFNLKLAATAKKLGIPVYYFIPPKVWAWKNGASALSDGYAGGCCAYFPSRSISISAKGST